MGCTKEETKEYENPCPTGQIRVEISQKIALIDKEGNWVENIKYNDLQLLPTDSDYNILYDNFIQVPNSFEATLIENSTEKYIQLYLGRTSEMKAISENICYYILKVNNNDFHRIKSVYDTVCHNFILTKFYYNEIEYQADDFGVVNIVLF